MQRLDPDRVAAAPGAETGADRPQDGPREKPPVVIDTRRYRWMVGIIGLILVVGFATYQYVSHGVTSTGVSPGRRLHLFAAPLAGTNLNGDPNPHPTCTPARHDPRALNVCLMAARGPVVLAFFVAGASQCERQVDALQTLSSRFPSVQFAAVAVGAGHAVTAAAVRRHHWTIPVGYDRDGAVQQLYGVVACPMVELAGRGGIVRNRLIGNRWQSAASLTPYVRGLTGGSGQPPA
ncbi:MAG TPA: redoxin domain-containing protein [Solirubrobacteraceae bacterium]|nr:redoxin domain-containing protein [Solirubrobacteraceae bacterium]